MRQMPINEDWVKPRGGEETIRFLASCTANESAQNMQAIDTPKVRRATAVLLIINIKCN